MMEENEYTKERVCFECRQENPLVDCSQCNLNDDDEKLVEEIKHDGITTVRRLIHE